MSNKHSHSQFPILEKEKKTTAIQLAMERIESCMKKKSTSLDLSGLGLVELPEIVFQLTGLKRLNVSNNKLTRLSHGIKSLRNLRELIATDNKLVEISEAIGYLRQLKRLVVGRNMLDSLPVTLNELRNLETLDLFYNQFCGFPESIGHLIGLKKLVLSSNRIAKIPNFIGNLTGLEKLDVSNNRIFELPEQIKELSRLEILDLSGNKFRALPNIIGECKNLMFLNVANNQLTDLPNSIRNLSRLTFFSISSNWFKVLPECIESLTMLSSLCVAGNEILKVPDWIGNFTRLEYLSLGKNPFKSVPDSLGKLTNLKGLDLNTEVCVLVWQEMHKAWEQCNAIEVGNLESIPSSLLQLSALKEIYLHGQTNLGIPPEVLGPRWNEHIVSAPEKALSKPATIFDYYFSIFGEHAQSRPLNEAKMILVGRGGVGKTSLVNRLVHGLYNPDESKTDGIAITPWAVTLNNETIRLNIWDFGGQEIMHATHQFFLTKRSLYLLVINAREGEQDSNVEYWLRLIESFGGDSPVLIVINKVADHLFDLNRRGLQSKFPSVRGFVQTDCESGVGIESLKTAILLETDQLDHLRDPFPNGWFKVKERLADLRASENMDYISFIRYQELCANNGVSEFTSQETLVNFLHDLGIVVSFRDNPRLSETQVLDPEWVTNGIYKILNAECLAKSLGELKLTDLSKVLDLKKYPKPMHLYLLDLMRKFELCYEFYDCSGHYLVPELLGKEEPNLDEFVQEDALRFEYSYNILPEGLLPRFIIRSRALNKNLPRWRTGVILKWDGNSAVVKADVQDKRICVTITGPITGRRSLLAVIRADLDYIHSSITKLEATELVPVPGYVGFHISYKKLLTFETNKVDEFPEEYNGKFVHLKVSDLLGGVEDRRNRPRGVICEGRETIRVAFSYSHKDEELRDQLEAHLKLMQRLGVISTWHDRKILAGEKWAGVIDDNFRSADIILFLVSADFLASDYCFEIEMQTALERDEKKEARVIPIIIRACDWSNAPFGKIEGLPKDMKPVTSWSNRDEAWTDVAYGIRKIAEQLTNKRG